MTKIHLLLLPALTFLVLPFIGCQNSETSEEINYYSIPTFRDSVVNAVIEIPSGTNHKIEYNAEKNVFENDMIDGRQRIIRFLPYPGNYGFIPSTLMDTLRGGDGDPLDVLVIAEAVPTATVMGIKPIGVLLLRDRGELDSKIIAIPANELFQVVEADDIQEFMVKHDAARRIIESWFLNYKGQGITELIGWRDADYALQEIKKWEIKQSK